MSLNLKIIQLSELDEIIDYEKKKLVEILPDEMDREMQAWNSRWRKESLEHYLPMGWSFLARDEQDRLLGYFIAQPLLFLDNQTQSLWVEHLQYSTLEARDQLCDLANKLCREKHFQKVYFAASSSIASVLKTMKGEDWHPQAIQIKTTKV